MGSTQQHMRRAGKQEASDSAVIVSAQRNILGSSLGPEAPWAGQCRATSSSGLANRGHRVVPSCSKQKGRSWGEQHAGVDDWVLLRRLTIMGPQGAHEMMMVSSACAHLLLERLTSQAPS